MALTYNSLFYGGVLNNGSNSLVVKSAYIIACSANIKFLVFHDVHQSNYSNSTSFSLINTQ